MLTDLARYFLYSVAIYSKGMYYRNKHMGMF